MRTRRGKFDYNLSEARIDELQMQIPKLWQEQEEKIQKMHKEVDQRLSYFKKYLWDY